MTGDAHQLVASGRQMAGVILVPQRLSIGAAIDDLEIVLECMSHNDARNQITYLPL